MAFNTDILKGKNIAITGASKGIGKETAKLLSSLGANLLLGARTLDALIEVSANQSNKVVHQFLDVTNEDSVRNFVELGISEFGEIDALVNCSGYGTFNSFLELSTEEFDRMISVNLRGTFLTSKYFSKHMVKNKRGQIININSIAGEMVLEGNAGYSSSKFGLLGLSKVMQLELRKQGVYVTSVLPGSTSTSFWDHIENHPDKSKMIPQDVVAKHIVSILCQPEGVVVEEVTITPPLGIL